MTFIPPRQVPRPGPQTHALVIGVGDYPYLRGGRIAEIPKHMGLGQLTSAPLSAAAFANWLLDRLTNDDAPLGSVDLLLSPGTFVETTGASQTVETATLDHIQQAFDRWYALCDTNPQNVAIFYFCGHGLERGSALLLPEDFGEAPQRLWEKCIDLNATHYALGDMKSQTQCIFVGACRQQPIDLLKTYGQPGRPLRNTTTLVFPDRDAPVLKAAPVGATASGPPNGVSYFTKTLLECLDGLGAEGFDGQRWFVSSSSLAVALRERMRRLVLPDGRRGTCSIEGGSSFSTVLHTFPTPPRVMAQIGCRPSQALHAAQIEVQQHGVVVDRRLPASEPWMTDLPTAGSYDVVVSFGPGAPFLGTTLPGQIAHPPLFTCFPRVGP